jgi:hypothetical protein
MTTHTEPAALTARERIILAVGLIIASAIARATELLPSGQRSTAAE